MSLTPLCQYFRGGFEFLSFDISYLIFALLVVQHEVATSVSILPWGVRILEFNVCYIIFAVLVVKSELATSVSILPWGSDSGIQYVMYNICFTNCAV